jgi:DNA-binding CsgD family transcriptional regulator
MKEMRGRHRRLLKVIDLIYEIDDCEQMLNEIFTELRRLLAHSSGVLLPIDPGTLELRGAFCFDCPSEHVSPYLEHYAAFDPYMRRGPEALALNRTVRLSDLPQFPLVNHSEFADFMPMVPYRHALGNVVGFDGQPLAAFCVHRPKGANDFGTHEAALIDRIAPHLGRALALRKWVADPQQRTHLGLLAFGADGRLVASNTAAQGMITPSQAAAVLAALSPTGSGCLRLGLQRYRVARLPWRAASLLTCFALHSPDTGELRDDHTVQHLFEEWDAVRRLGDQLTIVTLTPFRQRDDLRRRLGHYGLSPRELEITAQSMLSALTNADLARRLCISEDTVKSHLREAFRKIDIGSKQELLVKVLGLEDDAAPSTQRGKRR